MTAAPPTSPIEETMACNTLNTIKAAIEGANAHPIEVPKVRNMQTRYTILLPRISENGANIKGDDPTRKVVAVTDPETASKDVL